MSIRNANSTVIAKPFGAPRQVILSVGNNHLIIGSTALHNTHSRATRPSDLLLATLAADCTLTLQEVASDAGLVISNLNITAEWSNEEHTRARVRFMMFGVGSDLIEDLLDDVREMCETYRMLSQSIVIELEAIA